MALAGNVYDWVSLGLVGSPQVICRVKVSRMPGSVMVPVNVAIPFSSIAATGSSVTLAATFLTTRLNSVVADALSSSVAVIVTVWLSVGPSIVSNDQVQVPSPLSATVPTDADKVTGSPASSPK